MKVYIRYNYPPCLDLFVYTFKPGLHGYVYENGGSDWGIRGGEQPLGCLPPSGVDKSQEEVT